MGANVGGVAALADGAVGVLGGKGVDGVGAVVLLVGLAVGAGQIGADLGADADAVAGLGRLDVGADLEHAADDFVADADGQGTVAPAAIDGVHVGAADAAAVDGDVDITRFERLEGELGGG